MSLPVYKAGEAEAYAVKQGWGFRSASGNHLLLDLCPFCGKPHKFYWNNQTGLYDCKVCGIKGNYFTLLRDMGDAPASTRALPDVPVVEAKKRHKIEDFLSFEVALSDDPDAQKYLAERGLTMETARAWHLGMKQDAECKWLMIPYIQGGYILDVKYRSMPPAEKRYKRMGGGESILFGEHTLADTPVGQRDTLMICEGEIDAMTLWQHGYRPVLSTTTGAQSFAPRWYDVIVGYNPKTIYLLYDSDVAGQEGAKARLKQFDDRAIKNIILPTKDANEFFQEGHTKEELDALLAEVVEEEVPNVLSLATVLNRLEMDLFISGGGFNGVASQFGEINSLVGGGYWRGFLAILSGQSGIGKTSFALQELMWAAIHDVPSYMLCLEMPEEMMLRKLLEHRFHINKLDLTVEDIQEYRPHLESVPLYLGSQVRTIEDLEKTIRAAKKRYDIQLMVFDNINFFIRSRDHQTQEIGQVTKILKDLAVELDMAIIGVAQPGKFRTDERLMTGDDIKDSSAIQQDADIIMLLTRRRNNSTAKTFGKPSAAGNFYPECLVRIDKARYASGGEAMLYFDGAISTFRSLTPDEKDIMAKDYTASH